MPTRQLSTRPRYQLAGLAAVIAALLSVCDPVVAGDDVALTQCSGKVTVTIGGKLFTEYIFQEYAKPILYPIVGPYGVMMTRHYPMKEDVDNEAKDHPHQKSIWFTHGNVNGFDFWAEESNSKVSKRTGHIVQKSLRIQDNGIRTQDDWIAPDGSVVCSDRRTITFGTTAVGRWIDYTVFIEASHGDVTFGDTKEGTMGIRTNPLLRLQADPKRGNHTAAGKCVNSEGIEGKDIWGKRADWVDYWAPINGKTVGVAIFDHPSNPRHPTWWHARHYGLIAANPFGIHHFESKPAGAGDMRIESGKTVTFRYRFLFHKGDAWQAKIHDEYVRFASE